MRVFGFSLLRNGIMYDFPFKESLSSLAPVVEKIYLALAKSDDGTEKAVATLPKLHIIPTVWDNQQKASGGRILSQQSNIALTEIRKQDLKDEDWAIYLQADEVLLESEYDQLLKDLKTANEQNCDAVSFRYLHFWQSPKQFSYMKRWYPQEIRAIRVNSAIESWGDAQSFRNWKKIYESNITVFHYGHVKPPAVYEKKVIDIMDWWHSSDEVAKIRKRNIRREKKEKTLPYLGPHPKVMKERLNDFLAKYGEHKTDEITDKAKVWILGDKSKISARFIQGIRAKNVEFISSVLQIPPNQWNKVILSKPNLLLSILLGKQIPHKMLSPQARDWQTEFFLAVQLWQMGIPTDYIS